MAREKLNLVVSQRTQMSLLGYNRLGKKSKVYFGNRVFRNCFSNWVSVKDIADEKKLAYFLFMNCGGGMFYLGTPTLPNKADKPRFKSLAQVRIIPTGEFKFNFEFINTKGISRYPFWQEANID